MNNRESPTDNACSETGEGPIYGLNLFVGGVCFFTLCSGLSLVPLVWLDILGDFENYYSTFCGGLHLLFLAAAGCCALACLTRIFFANGLYGLLALPGLIAGLFAFLLFSALPPLETTTMLEQFLVQRWSRDSTMSSVLWLGHSFHPGLPLLGLATLIKNGLSILQQAYLLTHFVIILSLVAGFPSQRKHVGIMSLGLLAVSGLTLATWASSPTSLFFSMYFLLFVVCLQDFLQGNRGIGALLSSALAAGLLASSGYYGVLFVPITLLLCSLPWLLPGRRLGRLLLVWFIHIPLGLFVALPWFAKNALLRSNPFFPLLSKLLHGDGSASAALRYGSHDLQPLFLSSSNRTPLLSLMNTVETLAGLSIPEVVPAFQLTLHPLFCLAPLCLLLIPWHVGLFPLLIICGTAIASTLVSPLHATPVVAVSPLLAILVAHVLNRATQRPKLPRVQVGLRVLILLCILCIPLPSIHLALSQSQALSSFTGYRTKTDWLKEALPYYASLTYANEHLTTHDSLFLLNGQSSFMYFKPETRSEGTNAPQFLRQMLERNSNSLGVRKELHYSGITHLLGNEEFLLQRLPHKLELRWQDFKQHYLHKLHNKNGYTLWKLSFADASGSAEEDTNTMAEPSPSTSQSLMKRTQESAPLEE